MAYELRERRLERRRIVRQRTRRPVHVLIALLVQPAVRRRTTDATLRLQAAECERERRRQPLLLSFVAKASRCLAGCLANSVGVEGATLQRLHDGVAQLVDLLLGDTKLHCLLHVAVELAPYRQSEAEIGRGHDVRAAARGGELVDLERCRGGVGGFATRPPAREQRQVGPNTAHGPCPPGPLEDLRCVLPAQ